MKVTVDLGGMVEFLLLGEVPGGDDEANVIGLSTVAYLSAKDPGHVLLPAAIWHDAAYRSGASIQSEWPQWMVDREFLDKMLAIANSPTLHITPEQRYDLEREALALYLLVRKWGRNAYEGTVE
ncbi:hypothetical protein EP7_004324 [Isosphaeraceae bacterium EP7]